MLRADAVFSLDSKYDEERKAKMEERDPIAIPPSRLNYMKRYKAFQNGAPSLVLPCLFTSRQFAGIVREMWKNQPPGITAVRFPPVQVVKYRVGANNTFNSLYYIPFGMFGIFPTWYCDNALDHPNESMQTIKDQCRRVFYSSNSRRTAEEEFNRLKNWDITEEALKKMTDAPEAEISQFIKSLRIIRETNFVMNWYIPGVEISPDDRENGDMYLSALYEIGGNRTEFMWTNTRHEAYRYTFPQNSKEITDFYVSTYKRLFSTPSAKYIQFSDMFPRRDREYKAIGGDDDDADDSSHRSNNYVPPQPRKSSDEAGTQTTRESGSSSREHGTQADDDGHFQHAGLLVNSTQRSFSSAPTQNESSRVQISIAPELLNEIVEEMESRYVNTATDWLQLVSALVTQLHNDAIAACAKKDSDVAALESNFSQYNETCQDMYTEYKVAVRELHLARQHAYNTAVYDLANYAEELKANVARNEVAIRETNVQLHQTSDLLYRSFDHLQDLANVYDQQWSAMSHEFSKGSKESVKVISAYSQHLQGTLSYTDKQLKEVSKKVYVQKHEIESQTEPKLVLSKGVSAVVSYVVTATQASVQAADAVIQTIKNVSQCIEIQTENFTSGIHQSTEASSVDLGYGELYPVGEHPAEIRLSDTEKNLLLLNNRLELYQRDIDNLTRTIRSDADKYADLSRAKLELESRVLQNERYAKLAEDRRQRMEVLSERLRHSEIDLQNLQQDREHLQNHYTALVGNLEQRVRNADATAEQRLDAARQAEHLAVQVDTQREILDKELRQKLRLQEELHEMRRSFEKASHIRSQTMEELRDVQNELVELKVQRASFVNNVTKLNELSREQLLLYEKSVREQLIAHEDEFWADKLREKIEFERTNERLSNVVHRQVEDVQAMQSLESQLAVEKRKSSSSSARISELERQLALRQSQLRKDQHDMDTMVRHIDESSTAAANAEARAREAELQKKKSAEAAQREMDTLKQKALKTTESYEHTARSALLQKEGTTRRSLITKSKKPHVVRKRASDTPPKRAVSPISIGQPIIQANDRFTHLPNVYHAIIGSILEQPNCQFYVCEPGKALSHKPSSIDYQTIVTRSFPFGDVSSEVVRNSISIDMFMFLLQLRGIVMSEQLVQLVKEWTRNAGDLSAIKQSINLSSNKTAYHEIQSLIDGTYPAFVVSIDKESGTPTRPVTRIYFEMNSDDISNWMKSVPSVKPVSQTGRSRSLVPVVK